MFPPKKTSDPQAWITGLWTSLRHAAPHIGEHIGFEPINESSAEVSIRLVEKPTDKVDATMREYIRAYAKACGWKVANVKIKNGYVVFTVSIAAAPAASRA